MKLDSNGHILPIYTKSPDISSAFFILTENCNLRCKYCYENHKTRIMKPEVAKDGVDFLFRNSGKDPEIHITFFGGEPTLHPELMEIIIERAVENIEKPEYASKRLEFSIITNCTNFPEKMEKLWLKYGRRFNFSTQLSIDGPSHVQNANRVFVNGKGSWDIVEKNIDKWRELYKKIGRGGFNVHGCFTKETIEYMYETYLYWIEKQNISQLWFIPVVNSDWNENDSKIYEEQMRKIKDEVIRIAKEKNMPEFLHSFAPICNAFSPRGKAQKLCGAGNNFVSICPDGELSSCHQIQFNVGDNGYIGDIWNGVDDHKRRFFIEYDGRDFTQCEKCPHEHCYRCLAQSYDTRGSMMAIAGSEYCKLMLIDHKIQQEIKGEAGYMLNKNVPETNNECLCNLRSEAGNNDYTKGEKKCNCGDSNCGSKPKYIPEMDNITMEDIIYSIKELDRRFNRLEQFIINHN